MIKFLITLKDGTSITYISPTQLTRKFIKDSYIKNLYTPNRNIMEDFNSLIDKTSVKLYKTAINAQNNSLITLPEFSLPIQVYVD